MYLYSLLEGESFNYAKITLDCPHTNMTSTLSSSRVEGLGCWWGGGGTLYDMYREKHTCSSSSSLSLHVTRESERGERADATRRSLTLYRLNQHLVALTGTGSDTTQAALRFYTQSRRW